MERRWPPAASVLCSVVTSLALWALVILDHRLFAEGGIVEDEVRAGLFDGAEIRVSFVNWEDPDGHGDPAAPRHARRDPPHATGLFPRRAAGPLAVDCAESLTDYDAARDWGGQNLADGAPSEPDVFLSYAREDEARAAELAEALEQRGFAVFWDREVPVARTWHNYIGQALRAAKCIVVAWSGHSVASDWVIEEASEGKRRRVLAPVLLEEVQPPFGFGGIQAASLIGWRAGRPSREFDSLVAAVQRIVGGQAGSGVGAEAPSAAQPAPSTPTPKAKPSVGPASPSPASSEPRAAPMRPSDGWARAWSRWTVVAMLVGLVALAGAGGIVRRLTQPGPTEPTAGPPAPGLSIVGRWQGDVVQPGSQPYSTIMQVNEPSSRGTCGTVDYPELSCGGELHDCKEQSDGSYRMLERINPGQQQCIDGGTIQVRLSADSLTWAWFYPDGRWGATATLSRTEAPPLDR